MSCIIAGLLILGTLLCAAAWWGTREPTREQRTLWRHLDSTEWTHLENNYCAPDDYVPIVPQCHKDEQSGRCVPFEETPPMPVPDWSGQVDDGSEERVEI